MVRISKLEQDALLEIASMCSNHMSMALSAFMSRPVDLKINSRDIISLDKIKIDKDKEPMMFLCIYSTLEKGDLDGNILFAFPKSSALKLYDAISKKRLGSTKIVDDPVKSVLSEIGNIIAGKLLGIFNKFLEVKSQHTVPTVVPSFSDHIYDYVYFNLPSDYHKAMLLKVDARFRLNSAFIEGQVILLLSGRSFATILQMINNKARGLQ